MADASMSAQVAEEGRRPHRGAFPLPEARGRCPQGAAVLSGPRLSQNRRLLGRGAPPATPPLVLRCSPLGALAGLVSGAGGAAGVSPRPASLAGC